MSLPLATKSSKRKTKLSSILSPVKTSEPHPKNHSKQSNSRHTSDKQIQYESF